MNTEPETLQEAIVFFSDPDNCVRYIVGRRWPAGISCPTCGREDAAYVPSRRLWQCKTRHAKCQFSVKVGTVMEDSPIPLKSWLLTMWMITGCRNGISSYEIARTIGITQKSAWFMLHRLRLAMEDPLGKLGGTVEADETYVGGKIKNKHTKARKQGYQKDKTPVIGVVERGGRVIARVVPSTRKEHIHELMESSVEKSATIYTDDYPIYDRLKKLGFGHEIINHTQDRYVRGRVSTNTIENFWSCLKRTIKGTYVSVDPKHLNAYVVEQAFRFNVRKGFTEQERSFVLLHGITGKRLTYAELIGKTDSPNPRL
jgi:transposase-like protein